MLHKAFSGLLLRGSDSIDTVQTSSKVEDLPIADFVNWYKITRSVRILWKLPRSIIIASVLVYDLKLVTLDGSMKTAYIACRQPTTAKNYKHYLSLI